MNNGKYGIRDVVGGWSVASSRRNMKFLWSVQTHALTGAGYSFTLTIKNCPQTPQEWAKWCKVYWERLMAAGAIRLHWVIEWQRRGCPHLHGSIYFPATMSQDDVDNVLLDGWCYNNPYGPSRWLQRSLPIYEAVGWMQYIAKHAARGVRHYQRSPDNIPKHWKGRTGRMWGHRGLWPLREPVRVELEGRQGDGGMFAFRRLVRSYLVAKARSGGVWSSVGYARRMWKCGRRDLSELRGISDWAPQSIMERLIENLDSRGYSVESA